MKNSTLEIVSAIAFVVVVAVVSLSVYAYLNSNL